MASKSSVPGTKPRARGGVRKEPPAQRDLLAEWTTAAGLGPDIHSALVEWLAKQLVSDQFAKLEQGGHQEGRVPLRKVFVDLPITERPGFDAGHGDRRHFLKELLALEPAALCGDAASGSASVQAQLPGLFERSRFGFLVIGGPGQGKSTLSQLACQVHRAALLSPSAGRLSQPQREILAHFTDPSAEEEIGYPKAPLFPLHVSLPDAAAWLAQRTDLVETSPTSHPLSLVDWLSEQSEKHGKPVPAEALATLLRHAPFLLVLDGFDEVGDNRDRARVIAAARLLLVGGAEKEEPQSQGIVVATTRPQGYAGELDGVGVPLETVHLAPLRPGEALAYASKLAENKLADRPTEKTRVIEGVREAAREPTTARLMTTPLQVTILVALVQRMGRAPSERWSLFKRYFEVIYDRESERGTYAAPLLQAHRMHIERLHARVGLLLQAESEQGGGTEARMSAERLETVAHAVLLEDGIDEETRNTLVRRILRAAEERLVFLVEPEPRKFGFEIRSLQELMAAWALSEGGEDRTEARLLQVAPASMFRNVSLLLASKFFTDGSHLRDTLSERVCPTLEAASDAAGSKAKWGSILALEILEEGSVSNQPKYAVRLMAQACGLLDLPPCAEQARLARMAVGATCETLASQVKARMAQPAGRGALGAWVAVVEAANQGSEWAKGLADGAWEALRDGSDVLEACRQAGLSLAPWLAGRVEATPEKIRPDSLLDWPRRQLSGRDEGGETSWPVELARYSQRGSLHERFLPGGLVLFPTIGVTARDLNRLAEMSAAPAQWQTWVSVATFSQRPAATSLASTLRRIVESNGWDQRGQLSHYSPWPLAACLRAAATKEDLLEYASLADAGELGDTKEWTAAEQNWHLTSEDSLLRTLQGPLPWTVTTLSASPPLGTAQLDFWDVSWTSRTVQALRSMPNWTESSLVHAECARALMRALERAPETKTPEVLAAELDQWAKVSGFLSLETTMRLARTTPDGSGYLDLLDWLGRARSSGVMIGQILPLWPILDLLRRNPERHGLHYWIRILLSGSEMVAPAVLADLRTGALDTLTNHPPDTPSLLADATLTRLWLGGVAEEEIEPLLETIGQQAKEEPFLWVDAADLTLRSALPSSLQEAVLVALLRRPDLPWQGAAVAQSALRAVLQSRRSGLADPTVWKRLGLPLPLPTSHLLAAQGFTLPDEPVGLSQIRITHVRGLADLRLDDLAPAPSADKGQWVVLLGPNGAGKTTLLRSLVLALRNLANPQIWPEGTFETPWRANKIPPTTKSTIQIDLLDGRKFSTTIEKNGSERLTRSPKDAATPFPVFAYGCRRGSAAGGATRPMKYGEDDGPEVATLFNEDARLIHAETWLKEWHGEALEKPEQSGPIYRAVLTALQDLLKVDKIVVRDRQVWVSGKTIGEDIPFAALSDGYLTTAGWFLDLIARWIELAYKHPKHHKLEGGKILQRMTGIVLLDEIDLHLHPTWQINVIPKVKELLPRMSFVVTTHNPLTLVGARPEEIWILGTEDGHVTAERGTEAPMLLTGGQIYSRYFGIKGVYPNDLGEALRRYGFLSGDPLRTDDEQREMEGLREKLRARGIEPGWEETPREAPSVPTAAAEIKKPVGTRKRSPARKRSAP